MSYPTITKGAGASVIITVPPEWFISVSAISRKPYHQAIFVKTNIRNNSSTFKSDHGTSGPMQDAVSGATTFPIAPRQTSVELEILPYYAETSGKLSAKAIKDPKYASTKVEIEASAKSPTDSPGIPDYVSYLIFVEDTKDSAQVAGSGQFDDAVVTVHLVKTNQFYQYIPENLVEAPPTSTSTTANSDPIKLLALGVDLAYLSRRDPPTAPDGLYDWQVSDDGGATKNGHSIITNLIEEASILKGKGVFVPNPKEVSGFIDLALNPQKVDDRKDAFQAGLAIMSRLPQGSELQTELSNAAIGMLYNTIPHPPITFLGPEYSFRHADGGYNNILKPDFGRAGTRYSRSAQPKRCRPNHVLPDPGLVFDTLLKRKGFVPSQGGHSSFTFAVASLVTHQLFRTKRDDSTINETSSYLDLSVVYGHNQTTQDSVRDKSKGRGLLYPDTFAEERLLFLPPASSALLVLFARNHNYIAETLLKINEKKTWQDPPPANPKLAAQQDEEIFQTARLVNCGHWMSVIMGDYVAGFLGVSEGNAFGLDAFNDIKLNDGSVVTRGQGNHCSVEFNMLYRWHTTTSAADEKFTEAVFKKAFGKPFDQINLKDFEAAAGRVLGVSKPPKDREFGGLKRGSDGKFDDGDLANVLMSATENIAGQWRANGTPLVLRIVEIMGIEQGRKWGVCTMNEFRKFMKLKEFESFDQWNPDPTVARAAERLYGHIDNLELYTGLQCESTIPTSPGLWLPAGYTMMKAVLSDAIALVRGDRFYTTCFSPSTLTAWGYQDTKREPNNGGMGGAFPKLLTRHLPRHYTFNSTYTCFPFFTPEKMKSSLTKQGIADKYTFTRPVPVSVPKILNTFAAIKTVFSDPLHFKVPYGIKDPATSGGSILDQDGKTRHDADLALTMHSIFPKRDSIPQLARWYGELVTKKIQEKSWSYDGIPGRYIDIVKDVINSTAVHWAAERLCGISIKNKENPRGLYTEQELWAMYAALHTLNVESFDDPEHEFALRYAAKKAGEVIVPLVAKSVVEVAPHVASNIITRVVSQAASWIWPPTNKPCHEFLSKLSETGRPLKEIVTLVIGLCVASAVNHAHTAVHVIDFYLDDARAKERAQILQLIKKTDPSSVELLHGYVREGMRLNRQFAGLWRSAVVDANIVQGNDQPNVSIQAGDRIWASFTNAHMNPAEFPNPTAIDPTRPKKLYNLQGYGFHACPGYEMSLVTIVEMVRVIFSLKNIRRAPGDAGRLKKITMIKNETPTYQYVQPNGELSMWPGPMHVVYDP